jgi:hypothetical protein
VTWRTWLTDAADLLAEPDPGPTPFLVEGLIVDRAIVGGVGKWKTMKSYTLLDVSIAVATGWPAFGAFAIPQPGPVFFCNEESGRKALRRRLEALCRGRAIDPEELRGRLNVAANARIRLDDRGYQDELVAMGREIRPRLIVFDPLARMKAPSRDENAQREMAEVVEFLRHLRDEADSAVAFVHHTGHQGEQMRGTSDLESVWETRLTWKRTGQEPVVKLAAEHREAEATAEFEYRIVWDGDTRTMRFEIERDPREHAVAEYLREHPDASANKVFDALGGNRPKVLELVKKIRAQVAQGGTEPPVPPGYHPSAGTLAGGTHLPPFREGGNHRAVPGTDDQEPAQSERLGDEDEDEDESRTDAWDEDMDELERLLWKHADIAEGGFS